MNAPGRGQRIFPRMVMRRCAAPALRARHRRCNARCITMASFIRSVAARACVQSVDRAGRQVPASATHDINPNIPNIPENANTP